MLLPRLFALALAFTATSLASNGSSVPLWFANGALTDAGRGLLQEIQTIDRRGLRPADYNSTELQRLAVLVRQSPNADLIGRADAALTAAAARVASDLQRGR